jgi:hypothetical protein
MSRKRLWDVTEDEVSERVTLHICSSTKKYLLFRCLWLVCVVLTGSTSVVDEPTPPTVYPAMNSFSSPPHKIMCYVDHISTVLSF